MSDVKCSLSWRCVCPVGKGQWGFFRHVCNAFSDQLLSLGIVGLGPGKWLPFEKIPVWNFMCIYVDIDMHAPLHGSQPCRAKGAAVTQSRREPCRQGHRRRTGHGAELWQHEVHRSSARQPTPVFLPPDPHGQYEKAERYNTGRWAAQVRCPVWYWGRAEGTYCRRGQSGNNA